jgi:3',5'-cyclic AMP phosphodiesterase CpdA
MEQLQIRKNEIVIPGLKKEYKFLQITDIHVAHSDEGSDEFDLHMVEKSHKKWFDLKKEMATKAGEVSPAWCDEKSAEEMMELLGEHAETIGADALLISGDAVDFDSAANIRFMQDYIARRKVPVIYIPGNHEHMDEKEAHRNCYDLLTPIMLDPAFRVFDYGEFEIVAFDDAQKDATDEQIAALEAECAKGKPIVLLVHIPINLGYFKTTVRSQIGHYFLFGVEYDTENARKLVDVIARPDNNIVAILAGHIHYTAEGEFTEGRMQYTTSSGLIGGCREITVKGE